jgi:hypothetical protein
MVDRGLQLPADAVAGSAAAFFSVKACGSETRHVLGLFVSD